MTDEMFKPEWRPHPVLQTPHLAFFPLTLQKSRMVEGYRCYRGNDRTGTSTLQPRECHHWVTSCDEVFDTQGFSISGCSSSTELPHDPSAHLILDRCVCHILPAKSRSCQTLAYLPPSNLPTFSAFLSPITENKRSLLPQTSPSCVPGSPLPSQ